MGRRSVSLQDQDRWVFNRLADDYLARPPYPDALVERLAALAGGAGARAVDLGAGVGHLALPLAARGLRVTAVEPARAMLDALARRLAGSGLPVAPAHGAAEATGLAGGAFDLALLADAVQWVDPERCGGEVARLLAPGGAAAVIEARFAATPFMRGVAALLARENPKALPRPEGAARQILALAAPGATPAVETFRQEAPLHPGALAALLRSFSFAGPALAPRRLAALVEESAALAERCGGARFDRELTLRWAARRRPRGP